MTAALSDMAASIFAGLRAASTPPPPVEWPRRWGLEHVTLTPCGKTHTLRAAPRDPAWLDCPQCYGSGHESTPAGSAPCSRCGGLRRRVWLLNRALLPLSAAGQRAFDFARPGLPAGLAERMREMVRNPKRGAVLCGGVGTGKTHLALAVTLRLCARGEAARFVSWAAHLDAMRACFDGPGNADALRQQLATAAGLLVLDDMGAGKATDWTRQEAETLIDARYRAGLPVLVTTNLNPGGESGTSWAMVDSLGPRVASRLAEMCDVLAFDAADYRISC